MSPAFRSLLLLAVSAPCANAWITVSPEGNMTLMTTTQVGDWDHGTTGEPKDLYITGDVHIGKTNGSLFVQGDIMVRAPSLPPPPPSRPPELTRAACRSSMALSARTTPISRQAS